MNDTPGDDQPSQEPHPYDPYAPPTTNPYAPPQSNPYAAQQPPQQQSMQYPPQYPQQPGHQPGQPGGYYAPPPPAQYAPDHPQSTTALVLGILGILVCGFLAPFAWSLGRKAVTEIDASQGQLGGRGPANAGYILGVIGTIILGLGVLAIVGIFGLVILGTAAGA